MYENHFYVTKEMNKEFVKKILYFNHRFTAIYGGVISFLLITIGHISDNFYIILYGTLLLLMAIALITIIPHITLMNLLNYSQKIHNGTRPECIVTFGSNIKMKEGTFEIEIEYDKIITLYKLKSCNILMFTKQNGIMYSSNGFVGNSMGFDEFIINKCKNLEKVISR